MAANDRKAGEATAYLATALREAIGREDLSNAEVSRRSGVPYSTLRKILKGGQPVDYEELRRLAPTLGARVSALVARAEEIELIDAARRQGVVEQAGAARPAPHATTVTAEDIAAGVGLPRSGPRQRRTQPSTDTAERKNK